MSDGSGTLYSHSFTNPTKCADLAMSNQAGTLRTNDQANAAIIGEDLGSFGTVIAAPWISRKRMVLNTQRDQSVSATVMLIFFGPGRHRRPDTGRLE